MKKYHLLLSLLIIGIFLLTGQGYASEEANPEKLADPPVTTLILIRHAEKIIGPKDPELNEQGKQRAQELERMLSESGLTAIFSTDYIRTKETARPAAEAQNLKIQIYDPHAYESLFDRIKKHHQGGTILIVGHSNTIPVILNYLIGNERYEPLSEKDYDNLYLVSVEKFRKDATVTHLKFGR